MKEIFSRFAFASSPRALVRRVLLVMLIWPLCCIAQDDLSTFPEGASYFDWLDKPRDFLSTRFVSLSNKVDSFFGDERAFQEARTSYLRFYGDLVVQKDGTSNFNPQIQARVVLPALEKHLHLLIETNAATTPNANATTAEPTSSVVTQKGVPAIKTPQDFFAAIRLLVTDTLHWNVSTDAGLRIHGFALDPFVRARAGHVKDMDDWQFRLTESAYWFEQSGAGESTQFDADYKINEHNLARSRTVATWSDHDQQFYYQQGFTLFHAINDNQALSYQGNIYGENQLNSHVTEYDVSATWRIRMHREWLFFDVQPGLYWPETNGFRITPAILLRVEAIFGDMACGCYGI